MKELIFRKFKVDGKNAYEILSGHQAIGDIYSYDGKYLVHFNLWHKPLNHGELREIAKKLEDLSGFGVKKKQINYNKAARALEKEKLRKEQRERDKRK